MPVITAGTLWEIFRHSYQWLANLRRAKTARKKESVQALREVILASRRTTVYIGQLRDTGQRDHEKEAVLSELWTRLAFTLEDLGLEKLAEKCKIKGKQWADPAYSDAAFLARADNKLETIENLAEGILADMRRKHGD